jgi:DNA-binding CsgD family transcriptional regulator
LAIRGHLARTADLAWEAALADLRTASALSANGATRPEIGDPVRRAYRFAIAQGAVPLAQACENLAMTTGVPLTEPSDVSLGRGTPTRLNALTPREREILTHLVAGRTYAEIAAGLFISEKTVSTHISNLLRETGTRSAAK